MAPRRSGICRRPGAAALDQAATCYDPGCDADWQVHDKGQSPAGTGHKEAADRRAESGGQGGGGPPQGHGMSHPRVGNASTTTAREAGTSRAAPRPWTIRNKISSSGVAATAHATEATVKSAMPAAKILRRPRRSARRPDATRKAPKTMLYAFSTHDIVEIVEWGNDARMLGNANVDDRRVEKSEKSAEGRDDENRRRSWCPPVFGRCGNPRRHGLIEIRHHHLPPLVNRATIPMPLDTTVLTPKSPPGCRLFDAKRKEENGQGAAVLRCFGLQDLDDRISGSDSCGDP